MNIKQKIGQRIGIGFSGTKISDEFKRLVKEYKIGNAILFRDNLESASQTRQLCKEIHELIQEETGYPAFIAVDQEGGPVTRLPQDMVNVPGAMALAASGKIENVQLAAEITAEEIRRIGANLNLAPVLDINCNRDNPVIGNRSFAASAQDVSHYSSALIKAYAQKGLLCCAKHFPGHGDTAIDSHLDLPMVDLSLDELLKRELAPFIAAIEAGIPAIMTTHILFPQIEDERLPATMSKKILTGLLRERFGFKGLIISDGMEMKAIKDYYGVPKGCVLALTAGVDIVYICHESPDMEASIKEINAAYANENNKLDTSSELNTSELNTSIERIIRFKEKYAGFGLNAKDVDDDTVNHRRKQNAQLTRSTLALRNPGQAAPSLGNKPFFMGSLAYRSTIASAKPDTTLSFSRWFAQEFNGNFLETPVNPSSSEIADIVLQFQNNIDSGSAQLPPTSIVFGSYNGHLNRGQMDLACELFKTANKNGIPFLCLAMRNPWDISLLPEGAYGLVLWEYSQKSFEAAAAVLRNEFIPEGKIPVI